MQRFILIVLVLPLLSLGQANKLIRQGLKSTDYSEQIDLFTQAIEAEPNNLDAYFYRGLAKYNLGDYAGAVLDYTRILVSNPDADTYYNRGNSEFAMDDFESAKDDYTKAIALNHELYDAIYNLGLTEYYLGNYKEAIENFDKITSLFPTDPKPYTQKALAYLALKDYKEAFNNFGNRIVLNPDSDAFFARGQALLGINYFKEAQADFYKAVQLDRDNVPAYFFVSVTHLIMGEYVNAVSGFTETLKFDTTDFDAYLGLAMAQYKANDKIQAKVNFEKAKDLLKITEPNSPIEAFSSTYWYSNQLSYFRDLFNDLNSL